ncbi:hypothetical protein THASP1DRAFT_30415 [Thamnocephalis sphaerospora]|uniref:F-box domain-containing protein n=1 Tax=Thamnocephalis sphaerospora TaxID=78915 RepID=A0A4V1IWJ5_9FUNG|nr:hypothetical protein THASP1DRAFT_30415 [Thamnocephalis sphaerospora]|eukprot:RKP07779.1 hypothetical protein THASP1DRAFT_30415 [Thamnocephalis sphaerospora]
MNQAPGDILDCIVEVLDDEAALLLLSWTCVQWRTRITCRQSLWRRRFEQQFPQWDEKERMWLCQYKRANQTTTASAVSCARASQSGRHDAHVNWFDAYCSRRAIEYRWRHGQYVVHRPAIVTGASSRGIRLQSIPLVPLYRSSQSVLVATQWLTESQQPPIWRLERPCWGGVKTERTHIMMAWWSDEYLIVFILDKPYLRYILYIWRFTALHEVPRVVDISNRYIIDAKIYGHWFVGQYGETTQKVAFAYHLSENAWYHSGLGSKFKDCTLHITTDGMRIIRAEYDWAPLGGVLVTLMQQQVVYSSEASSPWRLAGTVSMSSGNPIKSLHIDDSRLILWAEYIANPTPDTLPTLVLFELTDGATDAPLKEAWARAVHIRSIQPIVSRNLVLIEQYHDRTTALLSLDDGAQIHCVHLDCWRVSGLYPPQAGWAKMAKDVVWPGSDQDTLVDASTITKRVSSPTAILYSQGDIITVFDYSNCAHRPSGDASCF